MARKRPRVAVATNAAMGGYGAEIRGEPVRGAVNAGDAADYRAQPQENYDALVGAANAASATTLRRRRRR